MKIKKVHDIVKRERTVNLWTGENGEQWIGTYEAAYDITGTPEIKSKTEFAGMNDLNDKAEVSLNFNQRPLKDWGELAHDTYACERKLKPLPTTIGAFGVVLHAFTDAERVYLVREHTLTPFDKEMEVYLRISDIGEKFIAMKEGFFLRALIRPYEFPKTKITETTVANLYLVAREIEREQTEYETGYPEQETLE